MTANNLLILDEDLSELANNMASSRGFTVSSRQCDDWRSAFNSEAKTNPAILANPTALIDAQIQSVMVINGPNLNLLGTREPDIYGTDTLADITTRCLAITESSPCSLHFEQTNHEGELVTWLQEATAIDAIVINAGAYTHTSIAVHDALKSFNGLVVELHISNPHQRESFRHTSYITDCSDAAAIGLGTEGYDLVIELLCADDT